MASQENPLQAAESAAPVVAQAAEHTAAPVAAAPEKLDELEEINFLLEEIESKIAPLALA